MLLSNNHQVTVIDNFSSGKPDNLPNHPKLQIICQDILQLKAEEIALNQPLFDGIAHLAATPSVQSSWVAPLAAHHNNLSATLAVIGLCQELAIPRLVIASSAAVYGEQQELPLKENQITRPISPYGLQKLVSEQYLQLFAEEYGFSGVALRLFNAFGPRQNPNSPYSGVISIFNQSIRENLPVIIYGNGLQTRDFVYVEDVAKAFLNSLTLPLEKGRTIICNIGTQTETSLLKLVEIFKACIPHSLSTIEYHPSRIGDIQHSLADISQAWELLSFKPTWTIESGLKKLVESDRSQLR
jgi:UDP-glucose 4-epimerase